jgi:hypothetical protein
MEEVCVSKSAGKPPQTKAGSSMSTKYRRLVDFDCDAWSTLIHLKFEMETSQNKVRVSISEVVNTVLKKSRLDKYEPLSEERIRAELLKLWSTSAVNPSEFQRGVESGLIFALQIVKSSATLEKT